MKKIVFILFAVIALTACKKEVKIEKNLWKKDGVWNIDTYDSKTTSTYFEADNNEYYYQNAGTIQFKKDGTGSFNFQGEVTPMTYSNTEKTLTIIFKDESGNPQDDETLTFDMEWKKNKIDLSFFRKDTYTTSDGLGGTVNVTFTESQNLKLSKK